VPKGRIVIDPCSLVRGDIDQFHWMASFGCLIRKGQGCSKEKTFDLIR
jgi:hypothetical protein